MVIFCVYTRERTKKPLNSEAYTRIKKKPSHAKKKIRDFSLAYTYTLKEITASQPEAEPYNGRTFFVILTKKTQILSFWSSLSLTVGQIFFAILILCSGELVLKYATNIYSHTVPSASATRHTSPIRWFSWPVAVH